MKSLHRLLFIPIAFVVLMLANCGDSSDDPKKDDPNVQVPGAITYTVVNSGSSAYSFSGNGLSLSTQVDTLFGLRPYKDLELVMPIVLA